MQCIFFLETLYLQLESELLGAEMENITLDASAGELSNLRGKLKSLKMQLRLILCAACDPSCHSRGVTYLSSSQEDVITNVPHTTSNNSKSNTREHIGVVSLPRVQFLSIWKSDRIKWTSTCKNTTTL